jgi:hypothetical protein
VLIVAAAGLIVANSIAAFGVASAMCAFWVVKSKTDGAISAPLVESDVRK